MDKESRDREGQSMAALQRLEDKLEEARRLPEPEAYRPEAGDPLEVLRARMRGEDVGHHDGPPEVAGGGQSPSPAGPGQGEYDRRRLGEALEASLRSRPLTGAIRAAIALRLSALMKDVDDSRLDEIWELVVFGDASGEP